MIRRLALGLAPLAVIAALPVAAALPAGRWLPICSDGEAHWLFLPDRVPDRPRRDDPMQGMCMHFACIRETRSLLKRAG